jgi:ankyrin repeat protein
VDGYESTVKLMLKVDEEDVNAKDTEFGRTPLSWVITDDSEVIVGLLLAAEKISINARDNLGQTRLVSASRHGSEAVVKLLLVTSKGRHRCAG